MFHTDTTRKITSFRVNSQDAIEIKFTTKNVLIVIAEEFVSFYNLKLDRSKFDENTSNFKTIYESYNSEIKPKERVLYKFPFFENKENKKRVYFEELMRIEIKQGKISFGNLHRREDYLALVSRKSDDSRQIDIINIKKCISTRISIRAKTKI